MPRRDPRFTGADVIRVWRLLTKTEQLIVLVYFYSLIRVSNTRKSGMFRPDLIARDIFEAIPGPQAAAIAKLLDLSIKTADLVEGVLQKLGLVTKEPISLPNDSFLIQALTSELLSARLDLSNALDKGNIQGDVIQNLQFRLDQCLSQPPTEVFIEKTVSDPGLLQEVDDLRANVEEFGQDIAALNTLLAEEEGRSQRIISLARGARTILVQIIGHNDATVGDSFPRDLIPVPPELATDEQFAIALLAIR